MGGRQREEVDYVDHESEPLFSASIDGDDVGATQDQPNASRSGISENDQTRSDARFPPQRYLKSTYASREAQYDLDTDDLAELDGDEDASNLDAQRLPSFHGLLGAAASRGSVESSRSHDDHDFDLDGLSVGGGKGSILASVSYVNLHILGKC